MKLVPLFLNDDVDESKGGIGNQTAPFRRKSVLSLKRIE